MAKAAKPGAAKPRASDDEAVDMDGVFAKLARGEDLTADERAAHDDHEAEQSALAAGTSDEEG